MDTNIKVGMCREMANENKSVTQTARVTFWKNKWNNESSQSGVTPFYFH